MIDILKILNTDCRLSPAQMAKMLGCTEVEVSQAMLDLENNHVILGYKAVINWERASQEVVTALIEVRVTPQRGDGFEKIAERIYQYPEVESLYLMSGGYDLAVTLNGSTMKDVALFVATKLAPIDGVSGTATHFVLKKYKESGVLFEVNSEKQERAFLI